MIVFGLYSLISLIGLGVPFWRDTHSFYFHSKQLVFVVSVLHTFLLRIPSLYVPIVLDMINHRNPPYLNVDSNSPHSSSSNPNDVYVVALRDIAPGEQLHNSYNQCTELVLVFLSPCVFLLVCHCVFYR